ncbi:hypothetical protein PUN28_011227 [Cardiocondyla obscurior]|uniref:Uncharacterized protein n=1 Tax=Cardiocondyla obscurior TaxID=286306 RepID=A0AAW2FM37_9HYME
MSIILMSLFTAFPTRNLTYKTWVPYNYSHPAIYFLTYCHQLVGMAASGIVNVGCESVICGLLLHICCQFEILEYRLTKLQDNEKILRDCVNHHNRIYKYAYTINHLFVRIIGLQFAVSMFVLCSNLYRIAMATDIAVFVSLMMYTGAILAQIFIYCWFGNEVKVKSQCRAHPIQSPPNVKSTQCRKVETSLYLEALINYNNFDGVLPVHLLL